MGHPLQYILKHYSTMKLVFIRYTFRSDGAPCKSNVVCTELDGEVCRRYGVNVIHQVWKAKLELNVVLIHLKMSMSMNPDWVPKVLIYNVICQGSDGSILSNDSICVVNDRVRGIISGEEGSAAIIELWYTRTDVFYRATCYFWDAIQ